MNKYSFKDILEKEISIPSDQGEDIKIALEKIEIPKIQRDYAQGRVFEINVRKRFLDSIFESLSKNTPMEMDFIYGSIEEDLNEKIKVHKFIPLDGQQRLTTLFLLYWYIGARELEVNKDGLYSLLKKFTYETRTSSREFCEKLTKTTIPFKKRPSEEITNFSWFYRPYKQDPTIKSMLNMLDAIHEKYETEDKKLFPNLENLQFYILPLSGFNLTDELYVKMNARGKQLTDFENLKANLIKWMKDDKNPQQTDFNKDIEFDGRKMPYYFSISQKIDTVWTDFFWKITRDYDNTKIDLKGNQLYPDREIVDLLFIRFLYRYFFQKYILSSKIDNKDIDKEEDYKLLYSEGKFKNFQIFEQLLDYELINNIESFFDKLKNNWSEIEKSILPSWDNEGKWTFLNNTQQSDRVIFLAISLFLEQKQNFDNDKFKQWMRVVWNIVENTEFVNAATMIGVMKLIEELSQNSYDIYTFLANSNNKIMSASSKDAVTEEREKSNFIKTDPNWEIEFISAEGHEFFKGSIGFIINDDMTINEFMHRREMAFKVFDNNGVNEKYRSNGHIFLRALISRYTDSKIIGQNLTDSNKHYLNKMLTSSKAVREAIIEWFSLKDEQELMDALNSAVEKDSQIQGWSKNDNSEKVRIRRAHEALYKVPELQDWMQEKRAIRFHMDWGRIHLYISRPRSWYDWIMLDTCRNEIIEFLISKGFTTKNTIDKPISYFWSWHIEVTGKMFDAEWKFIFDGDKTLKIERKSKNEDWKHYKSYDYVEKDIELKEILEKEIFSQS